MKQQIQEILQGAYDLHIHAAPDIRPRKGDDIELAGRMVDAGFKGCAIKSHFTPTAERAYYVRKRYPDFKAVGGIALNSSVGGLNPMAVETCARLGGMFVWFPTVDSKQDIERLIKNLPIMVDMEIKLTKAGLGPFGISILDEKGELVPEVHHILDIIKEYNMILSTGHLSHEETFKLLRTGQEKGLKKMLVAHVDWKGTYYTVEEQKKLVSLGAMLEHCYLTPSIPFEKICEEIKQVGYEHFIIGSDLGIVTLEPGYLGSIHSGDAPYPEEGMGIFVEVLLNNGFTSEQIRRMVVHNPDALLN